MQAVWQSETWILLAEQQVFSDLLTTARISGRQINTVAFLSRWHLRWCCCWRTNIPRFQKRCSALIMPCMRHREFGEVCANFWDQHNDIRRYHLTRFHEVLGSSSRISQPLEESVLIYFLKLMQCSTANGLIPTLWDCPTFKWTKTQNFHFLYWADTYYLLLATQNSSERCCVHSSRSGLSGQSRF